MLSQKIHLRAKLGALKAIIALIMLFLLPSVCRAESISLVTYYPEPKGVYDRLTLIPSVLPPSCAVGTLMVEQSSGKLNYCHNVSGVGTWGPLSSIWHQSGNSIYLTATDAKPLISTGIGTSTPDFKLTLDQDGGILAIGTFGSGATYSDVDVSRSAISKRRLIWYPAKAAFRAVDDLSTSTNINKLGDYSVAFGENNFAFSTTSVASGTNSTANGDYSVIAGGTTSSASANFATITGGYTAASGQYSTVSGYSNSIYANYATVGGGDWNSIYAPYATITGGNSNFIRDTGDYSTISAGENNAVFADRFPANYSVIAGGKGNYIYNGSNFNSIGGGYAHNVYGSYSYISGGVAQTIAASAQYSVSICAESYNTTQGAYSVTLTGGYILNANGPYSTIFGNGGSSSTIENTSTGSVMTGFGFNNISGNYSVIADGFGSSVSGKYSWAGGREMTLKDTADHTFVWGYSGYADRFNNWPVSITTPDAFIIAPGLNPPFRINPSLSIGEPNPTAVLNISAPSGDLLAVTSTNTASTNPGDIFIINDKGFIGIGNNNPQHPLQIGSHGILTAGGVWTPSSRKLKDNIQPLNTQESIAIIRKLRPVTYNYKINKAEHHVGFIAEDLPDLIASKDHKGINPMNVTAVLTSVLKEQKKEIADEERLLNTLDLKLRKIEEKLSQQH